MAIQPFKAEYHVAGLIALEYLSPNYMQVIGQAWDATFTIEESKKARAELESLAETLEDTELANILLSLADPSLSADELTGWLNQLQEIRIASDTRNRLLGFLEESTEPTG